MKIKALYRVIKSNSFYGLKKGDIVKQIDDRLLIFPDNREFVGCGMNDLSSQYLEKIEYRYEYVTIGDNVYIGKCDKTPFSTDTGFILLKADSPVFKKVWDIMRQEYPDIASVFTVHGNLVDFSKKKGVRK